MLGLRTVTLILLLLVTFFDRNWALNILGHGSEAGIALKEAVSEPNSHSSLPSRDNQFSLEPASSQVNSEVLLSATENAYNPIPSPDGTKIAYVRTGWGRGFPFVSLGRASLQSEIMVMDPSGRVLTQKPLAETFLSGWTTDGKNLICSRDWESFLISLDGTKSKYTRIPEDISWSDRPERVVYVSGLEAMAWVLRTDKGFSIRTLEKTIARKSAPLTEMLIPSPNERYIAAIGLLDNVLWVYDNRKKSWAKLGRVTIYPEYDRWDYIKPTWNPWFADSSRLAFVSGSRLVISSPDGKIKQKIINLNDAAGLAVPSPDGKFIAYATFEGMPMKRGKDLTFWGNSTIWVIPTIPGSTARPVTKKAPETTYDLRWLNNRELVFDRLADEPFYSNVRLWKTMITDP